MNARLKSVLVGVCLTLVAVALLACSSEPAPEPDAEPAVAAEEPAAAPEPRTVPATAEEEAAEEPESEVPEEEEEAAEQPEPAAADEDAAVEEPEPEPAVEPEEESGAEATVAPAPSSPDDPLSFDPAVVRGVLSNGLVYYIRHNEEPRERAHISLIVKVGSILEEEDQRGLAHFVEHMAFNGTERFAKQEIVEYLESIGSNFGPDVNASTGFDSTQYYVEIPTDDPEILEKAFQILSDWAFAITFAPDEVELERGVILEEWRLSRGFGARFQDNWFPLIFGDSRYTERAPIGLPEVFENAPAQRLVDFYERWYRPDLMAVIAVGDFDIEAIEAKVRQYFAPPRRARRARRPPPSGRLQIGLATACPSTRSRGSTCSAIPRRPVRRCTCCESSCPSRATTWRRCGASWRSAWRS